MKTPMQLFFTDRDNASIPLNLELSPIDRITQLVLVWTEPFGSYTPSRQSTVGNIWILTEHLWPLSIWCATHCLQQIQHVDLVLGLSARKIGLIGRSSKPALSPILAVSPYYSIRPSCSLHETGSSTGQWSQTQQQIYNRMCEKEKNQGVAMVQSESRPQPDWNAVVGPSESCA